MPTMRTLILRLLLPQVAGAMVVVGALEAQTVKQGGPNAALDPNAFRSLMVTETVLAPADAALWNSDDWTPEKPKPSKSAELQDKGGKGPVTKAAHVTNPRRIHDKLVTLLFPTSSIRMTW
jgi:hypothetical protein